MGKRALTEEAVLSGDVFCRGGRDEVGGERGVSQNERSTNADIMKTCLC